MSLPSPPTTASTDPPLSPLSASASTSQPPRRAKSPPLAFEKTPNDSLYAPIFPNRRRESPSGSPANMGFASPPTPGERDLQVIVDRQANAFEKMYEAFQAERDVWKLEKQRLHGRIAALEQLLKSSDHWSPAKSPIATPGGDISSPQSRALHGGITLPTIAEDENIPPLAERRECAPKSIELTPPPALSKRTSAVTYKDADGFQVEEIPASETHRSGRLSPPPPNNRTHAGHTPIRIPRRPTPPPAGLSLDDVEDTPTRTNTHINTLLSQTKEEDEDVALKGPLNMPELPHQADGSNFTLEMLSKKLEQIVKDPEGQSSRPMVFAQPSPGLASSANEPADRENQTISPRSKSKLGETPLAPASTFIDQPSTTTESPATIASPDKGGVMSPQEIHEAKIHNDFEQGGIRLKKKSSTNFGTPFGTIGGFPGRKTS
ncbi:unnamed protein product [Zymoseptoria tritici ST99CH_3D1]|nr:unnamed protein product [Zymoseptoria tritici ST99CH_3D1]